MAKWTDDATEYLEGYLRQVAALARRNGDDVDEIVGGLRAHVEEKALTGGVETVGLDLLLEVLGEVGSPGEVMGVDGEGVRESIRSAKSVPVRGGEAPEKPQVVVVQKSNTGRWIFATVMVLLFVASIPILLTVAAIVIPNLLRAREAAVRGDLRMECKQNLMKTGLALKVYAKDHDGWYPKLASEPGFIMFAKNDLYPKYLKERIFFLCPSDLLEHGGLSQENDEMTKLLEVTLGSEGSYLYPGLATQSIEDWRGYVKMYKGIVESERTGDPEPEVILPRFHEVSKRETSRVPVVIERPGHHGSDGGHVLFLDGHVEYIEMGEQYPMFEEFFELLGEID